MAAQLGFTCTHIHTPTYTHYLLSYTHTHTHTHSVHTVQFLHPRNNNIQ